MKANKIKKISMIILAVLILSVLINTAIAECWSCDGVCDLVCKIGPDGCAEDDEVECIEKCVCKGSGCVDFNPAVTYNEECPGKFDWILGNLESAADVLGREAVVEHIVNDLDNTGNNIGTLSSETMELFSTAVENKFDIPDNSLDIDSCIGNDDACSVDSSGIITIMLDDGINTSLNLDDLSLAPGTEVEAVIDESDPPARFNFNIPRGGYTSVKNPDGSTGYFMCDEMSTVSYGPGGNWLILPPGAYYIYTDKNNHETNIHVPLDGEDVKVYHGNLPAYGDGVGFSGPNVNNDGIEIRNADVVISYETEKGKFGITTGNMSDFEYVKISRGGDNVDYSADFRRIITADVSLTTGLQGISYSDGNMWACNPIVGSCPYDNESNLRISADWKEEETYVDEYPPYEQHTDIFEFSLVMYAQDRLYGESFSTCNCDNNIDCDESCGCDITCPLKGSQDWLYVVFGYEEYLKFLKGLEDNNGSSYCSRDLECRQSFGMSSLGSGYHLYRDGEIIDNEYRNTSGVLIYDKDGNLVQDNCEYISAFPGTLSHCINSGNEPGEICPLSCSDMEKEDKVCGSCSYGCLNRTLSFGKIKCEFQTEGINKIYYLPKVSYEFDADEPTKEDQCNKDSTVKIDFFCEKHCGYCNDFPKLDINQELFTIDKRDQLNLNLYTYIQDMYPESVHYEIISQSNQMIAQCSISKIEDKKCPDDKDSEFEMFGLYCKSKGSKGVSEIEIRAIDECGLDNHDDKTNKYQLFNITVD